MAIRPIVTVEDLDHILRTRLDTKIDSLIAEFACRDDEVLFWSGSWVDGLANSKSDLDFYLIGNADRQHGQPELTGVGMPPIYETMSRGPLRLDVTVVPAELIAAVAGYLTGFRYGLDHPAIWSDDLREFVHRLSIGVPVVGQPRFAQLQSLVDYQQFRNYLTATYHRGVDSLREDVAGLLEEGDLVAAYLNARRRLDLAVDMFLVSKGDTNTRTDKWRWKKLRRSAVEAPWVTADYLRYSSLPDSDDHGLRTHIEGCLRFGDRLVMESI
ncbi:MAG TPA: hypothetical protein VHZ33_09555 [Trebonia sp.]|jgi:hypothetical protein|nr:hypothetical protein [Trebonia sp.]